MMRVIYFIVRAVAYLFIGIWSAIAFIFYGSFKLLKQEFLRSKFYEQRILYTLAILLVQATLIVGIPVLTSFAFPNTIAHIDMKTEKLVWGTQPNWDLMRSMFIPMFFITLVSSCFGLYYANHKNDKSYFIDGEVSKSELKWSAKMIESKSKIDENDPDYRAATKELERDLSLQKHFENRLKT